MVPNLLDPTGSRHPAHRAGSFGRVKRRIFLGMVPAALLISACTAGPPEQFSVTTAPVETAAAEDFEFAVGELDVAAFAARIAGVNAQQTSYKLTIETPVAGDVNTMQVLCEFDSDGSLRLHAHGEINGSIQELITIGAEQWLKVDGEWEVVAGHLIFGGEGDKVEIFTAMLTQVAYQGTDEHGHRFAATMDVAGYENTDGHDHGEGDEHGGDEHEHEGDEHDHEEEQVLAPVTFWSDAQLRIVRLSHGLDDHGEDDVKLTIETRTAFGQAFNIVAPL